MEILDVKKVLEEFSDEPISFSSRNDPLKFTTHMLLKAESYFFVRVFDTTEERSPSISIQTFISDLPTSIAKDEELLAVICNSVNYQQDNGTTSSYIKDHKNNSFFLGVKLGIPFVNDVIKSISDTHKGEHLLKTFLYTAFIEITKTKGDLSKAILDRSSMNENA